MRYSRINAFVRIQRKSGGGEGYGSSAQWKDISEGKTYPVIWKDLNSIELYQASSNQAMHYAVLKIRRVEGLAANCRITKDDTAFNIIGCPKKTDDNWYEIKVGRAMSG